MESQEEADVYLYANLQEKPSSQALGRPKEWRFAALRFEAAAANLEGGLELPGLWPQGSGWQGSGPRP